LFSNSDIKEGFYADVPNDVYHDNTEWLSSSQIKHAFKSMREYKHYVLDGYKSYKNSDALVFGSAAHSLILEPDTFDAEYKILDDSKLDFRKKDGKDAKKEAKLAAIREKKQLVLKSDVDKIQDMKREIFRHPDAADLLSKGTAEVSAYWSHPETGNRLRCRYDFINREKQIIVDLKTSRDAKRHPFCNDFAYNFHYRLSAAMYVDSIKALLGEAYDFYFIVVEKEEPFNVAVYKLSDMSYDLGREEYMTALNRINNANKIGYRYQERVEEI